MVRITVIDTDGAVKECTVNCQGINVDIDEGQPEASFEVEDPDDDVLIECTPTPTVIAWSRRDPVRGRQTDLYASGP
jgi:hypothetical protein